jgi:creatinine amidohydrolase/Fe(II)-dependent formamide hydrolase-like protein
MLYLKPELVKMERAKKPELNLTSRMRELYMLSKENPGLMAVLNSLKGVPVETKKGGASHEISSNGIWSSGDPKRATKERGERIVKNMVDGAVKFIEVWKKAGK